MTTTSTAQPVIEALGGLLLGRPVGTNGVVAMAWFAGIALAGYLCARARFKRAPSR